VIVGARKQAVEGTLNKVVISKGYVANKECPHQINYGPKNESQTNTIDPLLQKKANGFINFRGMKQQGATQNNK